MLFTYDDLSQIINLNIEDKSIDELCINSAYDMMENYVGYTLEERKYTELQTVTDNKVLINQINITSVENIVDMNTKEKIENCVIDNFNKTIFFLNTEYNGHVLFINYNSGYKEETFPDELKEAVLKLYLTKKNNLMHKINNTENKDDSLITEDIKTILDKYKKKVL